MANTLNNTLNKVGNAIETVLGGNKNKWEAVKNPQITDGQTCLERFGFEARAEHLMRNEWKRDLQYTKLLVDAEYLIQTEFQVSSYEDRLKEQANNMAQREAEKQQKKAEKQAAKKAKKEAKEAKRAAKAASVQGGVVEDRAPEPRQVTTNAPNNQTMTNDLSWLPYAQQTGYAPQS